MSRENDLTHSFEVKGGDFSNAGSISTTIKEILQEIGIDSSITRRTAIAAYEGEMNVVMYARKGEVVLNLTPSKIQIRIADKGPGIEDIELAMKEGFSTATEEMREMGFGAGMGLPNIEKNADRFEISSTPGNGTSLNITFYLDQMEKK